MVWYMNVLAEKRFGELSAWINIVVVVSGSTVALAVTVATVISVAATAIDTVIFCIIIVINLTAKCNENAG